MKSWSSHTVSNVRCLLVCQQKQDRRKTNFYVVNFVEKTATRLFEDRRAKKIFHLENGQDFTFQNLKIHILLPIMPAFPLFPF